MTSLPPGPKESLLTTLRTTFHVARAPYQAMAAARARYGDPFTMTTINGTVVATADPALIREIFSNKDPDLYETFANAALTPFVGARSLLLLSGEPHRRERRLLTPPFHGERMRSYGQTIVEATRAAFSALTPGRRFVAIEVGQQISLEVIVRAVFGVEERARIDAGSAEIRAAMDAALPIFMFGTVFHKAPLGLGPWARYVRRSAAVDELLYEQIARVRPSAHERDDILSMMIAARYEDGEPMSDGQIRDELRTLLIAGHETTAVTMAWALDQLHRNPAALERLLAELDGCSAAPDELAKLPFLGAVVDETLRLCPVVEVVFRKLRRPLRFGGYDLPAGVSLTPAIALTHMREDLYPEPARFKPERMLERRPGPFEFLPFGGGSRRCIGAALASYELRVALGTALREWTLALHEPAPVPVVRRNLTLGPKTGVRMAMVGRRA